MHEHRSSPLPPCGGGVGGGGAKDALRSLEMSHPLSQHWERGPGGEGRRRQKPAGRRAGAISWSGGGAGSTGRGAPPTGLAPRRPSTLAA